MAFRILWRYWHQFWCCRDDYMTKNWNCKLMHVIKWTTSSSEHWHKSALISGTARDIWTKFSTAPNYQHAGTCQICLTWKSVTVTAAILNLGKCWYLQIWRRYLHLISQEDTSRPHRYDHVTKSQNWKLIHMTSSNKHHEQKCVDVGDYKKCWTKFGLELKNHTAIMLECAKFNYH